MRRDAAVVAALLLACLLWAVLGGKDVNSDLIHYHVYGPFSLLHGRVGQDFLPAGLQSYLNPLPHLPFYAMLMAGWHSVLIGGVLGALHGLALVLLYLIAREVLPAESGPDRAAAVLGTILGIASIPVLSAIGRVYTDLLTLLPVLTAVWLHCAGFLRRHPLRESAVLGILLGLAAGLKLTNVIYLAAALLWPVLRPPGSRLNSLAAYAAGALLGAVLGGGYWALLLWNAFGSPAFPLFNGLFQSPDFPPLNLTFERFRPHALDAFLLAPFRMALPVPMTYGEQTAPDFRIGLLVALMVALALRSAWRAGKEGFDANRAAYGTAVPGFFAFVVTGVVLWLATSFNARYGIGLLLLCGPAIAVALRALVPRRVFLWGLPLVLGAQSYWILVVSPSRMTPSEPYAWTRSWIEYDVPLPLRESPHLFLAVETQSYSFLAAYVHPDSRFVNVRGGYAVHLDGPGGARLARLMAEHRGRLRTLGSSLLQPGQKRPPGEWVLETNSQLGRLGLELDADDCLPIRPAPVIDGLARAANALVGLAAPYYLPYPMSCALRRVPVSEAYMRGRAAADAVFDAAERACPRAFAPGLARTEQSGSRWTRYYADTERDLVWDGTELFTMARVESRRSTIAVRTPPLSSPSTYRCP